MYVPYQLPFKNTLPLELKLQVECSLEIGF